MSKRWRPGDRREPVDTMIRVDQAGEYGATRIYAGQLAILGDRGPHAAEVAGMAQQEERHRAYFDAMIARRGVRPTALQPVWNVAGFALGAVTAAIGPEAAMACTVAVETEIDRHYQAQLDELGDEDAELKAMVAQFRDEELEHKEAALAHGAEQAPAYPVMSALIRAGCRIAIAASKRV
ncbi:demethoxyubiquinone hydroxylase family protein [Sphingomonas baiyangensis]|uniref:3-demethoxyubiquinol 3-hydroxylase n=1 Tax=Sphingomonas baiyangensis TaxID=2572576 RepID=A0A4U1L809_9SPHN|nr:demethoxyubiquinone hydroxylase family protein [Sphingomonas baiyangensis]TKD52904.1 demethoxyubiquinone hydroxylase family protein [Sphingomonas baiyangensis]